MRLGRSSTRRVLKDVAFADPNRQRPPQIPAFPSCMGISH